MNSSSQFVSKFKGWRCVTSASLAFCRASSTGAFKHDRMTITKTTNLAPKPEDPTKLLFGQMFTDHMFTAKWSEKDGWEAPKIGPLENFSLHPASSVFHYALELFEGLKAYRGSDNKVRMFRPDMNCKRLNVSAEYSCLPTVDPRELEKCIKDLVTLDKDWVPANSGVDCSLYIRPTYIGINPNLGVNKATQALLYVILSPVGPYYPTGTFRPVSLYCDPSFVRSWPGGIGEGKLGANYGPTIRLQQFAIGKGHQQVLWLFGADHELTEVGTMNLFVHWINENGEPEIATPPLNGLILAGVTRDSLLTLASKWGTHKVVERKITMNDVRKALKENRLLEMFGAGTACVVSPISQIQFVDEVLNIPTMDTGCHIATKAHKELTDIQYGNIPYDEWIVNID